MSFLRFRGTSAWVQTGDEPTTTLATRRDAEANQHLVRGLALLETNGPNSLRAAVACFDAAIALRRELPLAANPWFRYGLIAGWLNRGDALTRLGTGTDLRAAVAAYDEALRHLRELPMHASPLFVKRLAIAWLNRGITLLKQPLPESIPAAAESFAEAIAAAKNFFGLEPVAGRALLAGAWCNRANALIQLQPPQAAAARTATQTALELCLSQDRHDAVLAWISLESRHVFCQAVAESLATAELSATRREFLLAEAAEMVDAGLALARHWEGKGERQFRAAAVALFRFGCRVYQLHQPHFLTEFLLENLDPAQTADAFAADADLQASATEALWRRLAAWQRDGFRSVNTPQFETLLHRLRELRLTSERLAELRQNLESGNGACGV